MRSLREGVLVALVSLAFLLLVPSWLPAQTGVVMTDGSVVKCQKYEAKGNMYVMTMANGKLVSVRADKVDVKATAAYAEKMKAQAEADAQMKAAEEKAAQEKAAQEKAARAAAAKEAATSLTNEDLKKYQGQPSSMGDESSVSAEGGEMPSREDYEKMEKRGQPEPEKGKGAPPASPVKPPKGGDEKKEPGKE